MALKNNSKRKKQADLNRRALIEATLDSIVEIGIAQTSVSEIIKRAGLSRGMIHLHFGGKDGLFVSAVKRAGETYYNNLNRFLEKAGTPPQARVAAVVNGDLDETVLSNRAVSIWYAFRGEARERKTIAEYSDTRDERLNTLLFRAFREIAETEGLDEPATVARDATHGTLALLEGMWTDFLIHPDSFDRAVAKRIVFRFLAAMFSAHFDLMGAK
ncbi:MAG: TetR family transcriptional regulator [Rhodobacteraceae bacterium]|nr:TetR family transcriptional regulator [Paracoccaceae bacterium]